MSVTLLVSIIFLPCVCVGGGGGGWAWGGFKKYKAGVAMITFYHFMKIFNLNGTFCVNSTMKQAANNIH